MKEQYKPSTKATAAELQHSVDKDPTFLQLQAERDQRRLERESKYREVEATLLHRLADAGYHGSSLEEIVERNSPLSSKFVETLLGLLPETSDARVQEMMVRHLIDSAEPFDGRARNRSRLGEVRAGKLILAPKAKSATPVACRKSRWSRRN
jgi:hypothetical protein